MKNLAGQTMIYGLSSIVARFLNFFLSFFYTYIFTKSEYGNVTILYASVAFLNIILTYGMETGYFFFAKKEKDLSKVYGTAVISLLATTSLFVFFSLYFLHPISCLSGYENNSRYIFWIVLILGLDTLTAIPFAKLRQENKAFKFALYKLMNVLVTILFNFLLLWIIPHFLVHHGKLFGYHYRVDINLIFVANFIGSLSTLLMLFPDFIRSKIKFSFTLWKEMVNYSYPLLFAGLVGTINEVLDRFLLKAYLPRNVNSTAEIGVYGACIKVALLMTIFTQMFRFAAEPYFFGGHKNDDQKLVLADSTKYFFLLGLIIFLGVMAFIDIVKFSIGPEFREGLGVVPIYMLGSLGLGIYFNLSFWYKLNGKTYFGILITAIGAFVTIVLNIILIPHFSYLGSAWARFGCYVIITAISYVLGQKYYPINYPIKSLALYLFVALICFAVLMEFKLHNVVLNVIKNAFVFVSFIAYLEYKEKVISVFIKK